MLLTSYSLFILPTYHPSELSRQPLGIPFLSLGPRHGVRASCLNRSLIHPPKLDSTASCTSSIDYRPIHRRSQLSPCPGHFKVSSKFNVQLYAHRLSIIPHRTLDSTPTLLNPPSPSLDPTSESQHISARQSTPSTPSPTVSRHSKNPYSHFAPLACCFCSSPCSCRHVIHQVVAAAS